MKFTPIDIMIKKIALINVESVIFPLMMCQLKLDLYQTPNPIYRTKPCPVYEANTRSLYTETHIQDKTSGIQGLVYKVPVYETPGIHNKLLALSYNGRPVYGDQLQFTNKMQLLSLFLQNQKYLNDFAPLPSIVNTCGYCYII